MTTTIRYGILAGKSIRYGIVGGKKYQIWGSWWEKGAGSGKQPFRELVACISKEFGARS